MNKEIKGVTYTPISQFAQNNGLDENEFLDFIKSKWGEDVAKRLTLSSREAQGTLEKFADEYANEKFEKRAKEPKEGDSDLVKAAKEVNRTGKPADIYYVSQLPESVQKKLKDKQKQKLLDEGYSEKDADYYSDEFLNEKLYTAEEFYGKDFWKSPEFADEEPKYEIVNDFSIDAIKDNFTPPGAKDEEPDELDAYTKDLEDYLEKNPKAKDKNYY